eukprot:NODE_6329_length_1682_cov_6.210932.p4 GENE.NODE_6329_length_1682_cov_6.210932~~NODE_6329_length_1682_cov_6.210932.p4  ORF type:complete len:56 (+),score=3.75 NODE_6329_length_1682_cov_6.210932:1248-1415(+)
MEAFKKKLSGHMSGGSTAFVLASLLLTILLKLCACGRGKRPNVIERSLETLAACA